MNDRQESQSFRNLPRPQKVAVISLGVVAVAVLVIWVWQFNTRLNSPFRASSEEIAQAEKTAKEKAEAELLANSKDTDKDGLTDIEETNNYKTSPYLEDTDGDNISDFDEIRLNKDPLCAEGTDCALLTNISNTDDAVASSTNSVDNIDQDLLVKALNGEGTADTMRQILIQGGADLDQVNILSDEDLMNIYSDVLKAQRPGVIIATTTATSTNQ